MGQVLFGLFEYVFVVGLMWTNLLVAPVSSIVVFNATVALDGSGDFRRVGDAILAAPDNSNFRFYIHVKPGTYHEYIVIPSSKKFIALIGDDAFTTIIVGDRSNRTGFKTSDSATLTVRGEKFMAQFLSFENSAGPKNGQAVAVLDLTDYTSYYKCRFLGFQDTLYVKGTYHFFKECDVYGTVDFIFGNGIVVFQDCNLYARIPNQLITVTAQSRDDQRSKSGFTFQNCTVKAAPDINISDRRNVKVYLGRPWRPYSRVVFMESFLDYVVMPDGWLTWPGVPVNYLFYAEYNNRGPGAKISGRVNWSGFHVINKEEALQFTVDKFINASDWLPETSIPFKRGLLYN